VARGTGVPPGGAARDVHLPRGAQCRAHPTTEALKEANSEAAVVRQLLANRDIDCPGCGYNLRAIITGRCPECGLEITLKSLRKLRHKPLPTHLYFAMVLFYIASVILSIPLIQSAGLHADVFSLVVVGFPLALWYGAWFVGSKASGEHDGSKLSVLGAILWGVVAVEICAIAVVYASFL